MNRIGGNPKTKHGRKGAEKRKTKFDQNKTIQKTGFIFSAIAASQSHGE